MRNLIKTVISDMTPQGSSPDKLQLMGRLSCDKVEKGERLHIGLILSLVMVAVAACAPGAQPDQAQQAAQAAPFQGVPVAQLLGRDVVDSNGRKLGTIRLIVQRKDGGALYAVVERQGEAAQGQSMVMLDDLRWDGGGWRGSALQRFELDRPSALIGYYAPDFRPLAPELVIGPHGPGGGGDQ